MVKRTGFLLLACAGVALVLATADDAQAFGRRGGGNGSCGIWGGRSLGSNGGN